MESLNDRPSMYADFLNNPIEKIRKLLPKKHKDLRELLSRTQEDIKLEKEQEPNANKHYLLFKLSIQTKNSKIIEICLYYLQKLISNNFLDGNCADHTFNINLDEIIQQNPDPYYFHRRLIDSVVENIAGCMNEKDENIQLLVINILLTLLTNPKVEIHEKSLQTAFKTFIHIYSLSKNNVIQTTARAALTQASSTLFQRLENFVKQGKNPEENPNNNILPIDEEEQNREIDFILKIYMSNVVRNIVDNVCLFDEKAKTVTNKIQENQELDPAKKTEELSKELSLIPLRSVPLINETDDLKYKKIMTVSIDNEQNVVSGKFGWCFVCRKSANVYCKDSRVPVCTAECKKKHLDELNIVNSLFGINHHKKDNILLIDCLEIFKMFAKLSSKDSVKDLSTYNLRSKILALEVIFAILEKPLGQLHQNKDFIEIIKSILCGSILNNCVASDQNVFKLSFGIFLILVNSYKENLKREIVVFLDQIFVKFLESGNSTYTHRLLVLEVFNRIFKNTRNILELYVNYDCDVDSVNIFEKIVEVLTRIAQGKYLKSEYSMMIQPNQELVLRTLSLETLIEMLRGLSKFVEDAEKEKDQLEENKNPDASALNKDNNEDDKESNNADDGASKLEAYDTIEKSRNAKMQLQKAIRKFNFKPKQGIQHLVTYGIIAENNAPDLAKFIYNCPSISKQKIGEFFGEENPFNIDVMSEYADYMNFKSMNIDDGLRHFLDHFTLPGESQKVDRIMQVFAQKYYKYNPDNPLSSTTAAYTLSYLAIMLQTDLHNPLNKDKMKLVDFIKLARGINDGQDLTPDYLTGLYNRIAKRPLAIHEQVKADKSAQEAINSSLRKKHFLFLQESKEMLQRGKDLIKSQKESVYLTVTSWEYVRPLLDIIWSPCLASFSVLLEENDDPKILSLCMEGFNYGIQLTSLFNMQTEREAWVLSLAKFTSLTSLKELKEKNIQCVKLLLNIALNYGNFLKSSWIYVLECISRLDYLHVLGSGGRKDAEIFGQRAPNTNKHAEMHEFVEQMKSENLMGHIDPADIDKIFNRSVLLDGESILDFISCLCKLSEEELKTNSRIFSLQKIVEVADYNMNRIRIIWTRIWNVVKEFFSKAGCHPNSQVSMFVIDSLKQLSNKFLHKEELSHYEFQKEFLKPFETIFINLPQTHSDLKEFIMTCMQMITQTMYNNLKSGWKTILNLVILSIHEDRESLTQISYKILSKIMNENLDQVFEVFVELIQALTKMCQNKDEDIALNSIEYLKRALFYLIEKVNFYEKAKNTLSEIKEIPSETQENKPEENKRDFLAEYKKLLDTLWIPILISLSGLFAEPRMKIQAKSLDSLFLILQQYGHSFSNDFWTMTFRGVLRPLFDEIHFTFHMRSRELDHIKKSCENAFNYLIKLFSSFFDNLCGLFNEIIEIILNCIQNTHEALAKISITSFGAVIMRNASKLKKEHWELILDTFEKIFKLNTPRQLMDHKVLESDISANEHTPGQNINFNTEECVTQCIVQLFSIGAIKDMIESQYQYLENTQILKLLKILEDSYKFAKEFNEEIPLRYSLWINGFMSDMKQLPGLLKQEREALSCYCMILFKHYQMNKDKEKGQEILEIFLNKSISIMITYATKQNELLESSKANKVKHKKSLREESKFNTKSSMKSKEDLKKSEDMIKKTTSAALNNNENKPPEDSYGIMIKKLRLHELERDITNLRTILAHIIIPKLNTVEIANMGGKLKELANALINISIFSFAKCYACMTCNHCQGCANCSHVSSDDADIGLKLLLQKIVDYSLKDVN